MTDQQPDQANIDWAHRELKTAEAHLTATRSNLWSNLRDRMMTLAASTIPLSLIAIGISDLPSQIYLIQWSWIALLISIALGFVSIVIDYQVTARGEASAQAGIKLASGVIDDESIATAEKRNQWWQKWSRPLVRVTDWSVYAGLLRFWIGILLLVRFAWVNVEGVKNLGPVLN